jgi:hypothetical protein
LGSSNRRRLREEDVIGYLEAFAIFLVLVVVFSIISFLFAYDPERHGKPWHRHIEDVVLDCDGLPLEEYKERK